MSAAVATICSLCDLPGAVAVGIWAGVWFVVPAIGNGGRIVADGGAARASTRGLWRG